MKFYKFKQQILFVAFACLLISCGINGEKAMEAETSEDSATDLITFFEEADSEIKKLAKSASNAVDQKNYSLALHYINQLKAQGRMLSSDQFMVVSTAGVNLQGAIADAAERGDKKAQTILNMQSAGRRN